MTFREWSEELDLDLAIEREAAKERNPQGHTIDSIEDILDTLRRESRSCYDPKGLTYDQSVAAALAYDEWRYLLHSVDGLNT